MTDKEKREVKNGVISIFKRFNILDHTATISGLRDDILEYIDSLQEEPVSCKPLIDIEIPFGARDSELIKESIAIPEGCYATIEGNKVVIRKGEEPVITNVDTEPIGVPASKVELANIPDKDPISDDCGIDLNGQGKIAPNYGVKLAEEPLRCTKSDIDEKLKKRAELLLRHTRILTEMRDEELEEAAKNHAVERYRTTRDMVLAEKCKWSFKAGAQWQEEQDKETIELAEDHAMFAGMEKMKKQMIDKACVWLEKNTGFFNEKDFRKAMED